MPHRKTRHKRRKLRSLFLWHRYIGLTAALFVIVLSVTGILLNHTESLDLDNRFVSNDSLLDWYGIAMPMQISAHAIGDIHISELEGRLFWDTQELGGQDHALIGAVAIGDMVVVASSGNLLLLTADGELVERLDSSAGVPAGMKAVGVTADGHMAVDAAHGLYQADDQFLEWRKSDNLDAQWSSPINLPERKLETLGQSYRGHGLPLERVILDLHSGRILGQGGVLLMDATAILLLFLSGSGIWLWVRRKIGARAQRRRRRK